MSVAEIQGATGIHYDLGPVKPLTEQAAYLLGSMFGIKTVYGWRASDPISQDHPSGHADDFMVPDTATGEALASYAVEHADELGIKYIVWNRQIWSVDHGRVWKPYTSSNNPHTDHVHITFFDTNSSGSTSPNIPFVGAAGDVLAKLLSPAATVADVIRPIGVAAAHLVDPKFWRRIGMGVVGGSLIVVGLVFINRRSIGGAVDSTGRVVGSVAGTAIQGFSFGAGMSAVGRRAGGHPPASGVPGGGPSRPGPRPPAIRGPVSAVPVTAPAIRAPVSPGGTYNVTTARGVAPNPTQYRPPRGGSLLESATARKGRSVGKKPGRRTASKPFIANPMRQEPYGGQ